MPLSYPASCDHLVARPPTYDESMNHFYNNLDRGLIHNRNELHYRTLQYNRSHKKYRRSKNINVNSDEELYPPKSLRLKQRLCNIL